MLSSFDGVPYNDLVILEQAYRTYSIKEEKKGKYLLTSIEEFIGGYRGQLVKDYVDHYQFVSVYPKNDDDSTDSIDPEKSGGGKWYYDTGTSLPCQPLYSNNNLLVVVSAGDIIIEDDSYTSGIVGHAALVEGKFYSAQYGTYYVRLIEAILPGVKRSVIDGTRYSEKNSRVYRVPSAGVSDKSSAVSFSASQLNKPWFFTSSHYSGSKPTWYCSELVWASYYNTGIDLVPGLSYDLPLLPAALENSSLINSVTVSTF